MDDQWLTIHCGGVTHCWNLGQPDVSEVADLVARARTQSGFPCGDSWAGADMARNAVQMSPGEPHPSLLAVATVHTRSSLDRVDPSACLAECARLRKAAHVEAAEAMLAGLPDADVDELIERRRPQVVTGKVR